MEYCKLLDEESALLSPEAFFGVEGYLRICTGMPADALVERSSRLDAFMGRLG